MKQIIVLVLFLSCGELISTKRGSTYSDVARAILTKKFLNIKTENELKEMKIVPTPRCQTLLANISREQLCHLYNNEMRPQTEAEHQ